MTSHSVAAMRASRGRPMPALARQDMEARFGGADFRDVRIHTDDQAQLGASLLRARALTFGQHIYFARDSFQPTSVAGRQLLAHELTHTLQQGAVDPGARPRGISRPADAGEREATTAAGDAMAGRIVSVPGAVVPTIQRDVQMSDMVFIVQKAAFEQQLKRYNAAVRAGQVSKEEQAEVEQALLKAEFAIRGRHRVVAPGSGAMAASAGALAFTGGLVADDVTGIGVADDILIPFALGAAGVLAIIGWIQSSPQRDISKATDAASRAVDNAITTISGILLAQKLGEQVRGHTNQIAIHLARVLGETVAGRPPDHQQDPNRDRNHWWKEIKTFVQNIAKKRLTPKQLLRELRKKFTDAEIKSIREAMKKAAELMNDNFPNFPPAIP